MQNILNRDESDPIRETIFKHLTVKDLTVLKMVFKNFDLTFSVIDLEGQKHTFGSVTSENCRKYKEIQQKKFNFFLNACRRLQDEVIQEMLRRPDMIDLLHKDVRRGLIRGPIKKT